MGALIFSIFFRGPSDHTNGETAHQAERTHSNVFTREISVLPFGSLRACAWLFSVYLQNHLAQDHSFAKGCTLFKADLCGGNNVVAPVLCLLEAQ